jgi:hypothetical protein
MAKNSVKQPATLHGDCRTGYNEFLSVHADALILLRSCISSAGPLSPLLEIEAYSEEH